MIIVDVHEPEEIVEALKQSGAKVVVKAISPGDYVINGVGIERKSMSDFYNSIIKKRLFDQLSRLKDCYSKSILIVEGDLSEVSLYRNPRMFWGAYLSVILDFEVPVIFTPSREETVNLLTTLEKRMSKTERKSIYLRYKPKMMSEDDWKLFIIESLPQIGPKLAEKLLKKFKTVRGVVNASLFDLMSIPEIGEKRARRIVKLLTSEYMAQKKLDEEK